MKSNPSFNKKAIQLTDAAFDIYQSTLQELGLYKKAVSFSYKAKGSIGGQDNDAINHLISKFQNSALRIACISLNHKNEFDTISGWIKTAFSIGKIRLLDLACGSGAGSLGLISTIFELRNNNIIDNLPLNVEIVAADNSEVSLEHFSLIISKLKKKLDGASINLLFKTKKWDAESSTSSTDLMDSFITNKDDEFFILINNFSGATFKSEDIQKIIPYTILSRISNKNCTLVWVEPTRYKKAVKTFKKLSKELSKLFSTKKTSRGKAEYKILDRLNNKTVNSGVFVHSDRIGNYEL